MKTLFTSFLVAFMAITVSLKAQQSADSLTSQLNLFLDQWHRDAAEGNHTEYIGKMAPDGVFIGTDASEYWTVSAFGAWSKPYFDKKRSWAFKPVNRNIYTGEDGITAWFDELLATQMGVCRGSGVLVRRDGKWEIAQYVLSATIPNDLMKKVTTMKSETDSALVLQNIFQKNGMTGTMIVYDPANSRYFGFTPARWDSGFLPASTFKIANALIGLETGVIDTGYVFRWKGEKRQLPQWEKDLTLHDAFMVSCVPCFQQLAGKIGADRMNSYLAKMKYPGMDVRSDNIDRFWLEGSSRITPRQQVEFLSRLYLEELPLKKPVLLAVKNIMVIEATPGYALSGKTGWAVRNGNNYGWFVGWVKTGNRVYFVATLVEPKDQAKTGDFAAARKLVTMEALRALGIINP